MWVILHLLSFKAVVILRQASPHARHFIIDGVRQEWTLKISAR
jgi:hypothetical protein